MVKSIIVAFDKNYGIGADNDVLWQRDLPADLRHFKDLTTGNTIIMGRHTYESIGRPLPDRQNIVISQTLKKPIEGIEIVTSLEEAYKKAKFEVFVIGGGFVYGEAFATVDRIYATEVDEAFEKASVFFPKIEMDDWEITSRSHHSKDADNKYDYDFVTYDRRSLSAVT